MPSPTGWSPGVPQQQQLGMAGRLYPWFVKFPRLKKVPQAVLFSHVGEKGWCCLSLGKGDICSGLAVVKWQIERQSGEGAHLQWSCLSCLCRFFHSWVSCTRQLLLGVPAASCQSTSWWQHPHIFLSTCEAPRPWGGGTGTALEAETSFHKVSTAPWLAGQQLLINNCTGLLIQPPIWTLNYWY